MSERCKKDITYGSWSRVRQCKRSAVKDGYCHQHHPDEEAARDKLKTDAADKRWNNHPAIRLGVAVKRIKKLEDAIRTHKNSFSNPDDMTAEEDKQLWAALGDPS